MYQCGQMYECPKTAEEMPKIEEVTDADIRELKKGALADFDYPIDHVHQELKVFTLEEIIKKVPTDK